MKSRGSCRSLSTTSLLPQVATAMLTLSTRTPRTDAGEVKELVDGFRRSVRMVEYPDPKWYWKDLFRLDRDSGFVNRLHRMIVAPANAQVPIEDALAPVIAAASLVLHRYAPPMSDIQRVMHDETVAQSASDVWESFVRLDGKAKDPAVLRKCRETMMVHWARLGDAIQAVCAIEEEVNNRPPRAA